MPKDMKLNNSTLKNFIPAARKLSLRIEN